MVRVLQPGGSGCADCLYHLWGGSGNPAWDTMAPSSSTMVRWSQTDLVVTSWWPPTRAYSGSCPSHVVVEAGAFLLLRNESPSCSSRDHWSVSPAVTSHWNQPVKQSSSKQVVMSLSRLVFQTFFLIWALGANRTTPTFGPGRCVACWAVHPEMCPIAYRWADLMGSPSHSGKLCGDTFDPTAAATGCGIRGT